MKVGDTFRVFEVVDNNLTIFGKTGIEYKYDNNGSLNHRIYLNAKCFSNIWMKPKELKQVGTIRIKSLKS